MGGEVLIPIVMFVMIFSVPLMAIYTKHKRELAEIQGQKGNGLTEVEAESLRAEVKALRDKVNALTLEMDGVNSLIRGMNAQSVREMKESGELRERL